MFNKYDSNNDGIMEFDEVERMFDDGKANRERGLGGSGSTV